MKSVTLSDLQESVQDKSAFDGLGDYLKLCKTFLSFIGDSATTKIISPSQPNYFFYQYSEKFGHKISRPLNKNLFEESPDEFDAIFQRFINFLDDLKNDQGKIRNNRKCRSYLQSKEIHTVVYTIQQSIGCVSDSFNNSNQSRKRVGQLFERLIKLLIQELGIECQPRTIKIPIPGYEDRYMPYELDVVFSRNKAVLTAESKFIHSCEVVGSIKTSSKDRIDKIFLDKFLITKLLGRDIPVIAIFLHDVQRAKRGESIFGVNSTFKTNHFLGYTIALNKFDGVYYVDPRPEMFSNKKLAEQIFDFQKFLINDLWVLSNRK